MRAVWTALIAACAEVAADEPTSDTDRAGDTQVACAPLGAVDCPVPIRAFPAEDRRSTVGAAAGWDRYACAPDKAEGGGEVVYAVSVPGPGALIAQVEDGAGVDVDVHLLDAADPGACRVRDDRGLVWVVEAGTVWLVVDTFVGAGGVARPGDYTLRVDFAPMPTGRCAFADRDLAMSWRACAPGIDCAEVGGEVRLHTPSAGPVVKEAHLVTVDDGFGGAWPTSATDRVAEHYARSEAVSGYAMARTEPWAPAGEGGSQWGQGSTGAPLPALDEAWYLNMFWRSRPAKGTRMVVWNPVTRAVVIASGGYETGPGDPAAVAGVTEEIHHALGSRHLGRLIVGFAADGAAPLGPCR